MPRKPKPPTIEKHWKIEVLTNALDSVETTLSSPNFYDPEEKESLIWLRDFNKSWLAELEGKAQPNLSKDKIDQKINFIDDEISMWSQIPASDESLPDDERAGILEDIQKLRLWKAELRKLKVSK